MDGPSEWTEVRDFELQRRRVIVQRANIKAESYKIATFLFTKDLNICNNGEIF